MSISSNVTENLTVECEVCKKQGHLKIPYFGELDWLVVQGVINTRVMHFETLDINTLRKPQVTLLRGIPMEKYVFCKDACFVEYVRKNCVSFIKDLAKEDKKYKLSIV